MTVPFKPALIGALLLLAGATQYFAYAAYVSPREHAARELGALTEVLRIENRKKPVPPAQENRGATIPDLLSRVQELATQNAVTLKGVEPLPGDGEPFKLRLTANYGNLLEFLARFATLAVDVTGFDAVPAMNAPGALEFSLSFNHVAAANTVRPERIGAFMDRLKNAALRDPFNPANTPIQMVASAANPDDLTWSFRLTSISEIGKTKYATIDGKDYNVGDKIQGFVIGAIGDNKVTLIAKEDGKERQRVLTFRNNSKNRT
jgi:hypothetical protein